MSVWGVPRVPPGAIARPHLQSRLDDAAPLAVLHAPAGYGKTVALAQWAAHTDVDGVWLRAREEIAAPPAFVEQLAHALDDAGLLDNGNPLARVGVGASSGDVWALLERGLHRVGRPLTVVVDGSESLREDTILGILGLLTEVPHLSVKTSTRTSDAFTEPGLSIAIAVTRIGPADLVLSAAETATLLGEPEEADRVRQVLEVGATPALARVVALDAEGGASAEEHIESLLRLRAHTFDARFATFLQRIALTDAIDADFAAELTGEPDAEALLDQAEREGLGTWAAGRPHATAERSFELSPLFQQAIARYARRELAGATLRDLDLRVAHWHRAHHRPLAALRLAVARQEWGLATDIVRENWHDVLHGDLDISGLFADVPMLTLRRLPVITTALAVRADAVATQRTHALEYFALAIYGARRHRAQSRPADRALMFTIESAAHRISGRAGAALKAADGALDTLKGMGSEEQDRLGRATPIVYNQIGTTLFYADRGDDALACFRTSSGLSDARGLGDGLQGLALEAGAHAIRGDMPEAARALAEIDRRAWPDGYPGSFAHVARAWLDLEGGEADAATAHLQTLESRRPTIEHWAVLAHLDATMALLQGEAEAALVRLDTVLREHTARSSAHAGMVASLRPVRALIELARGDATAAAAALAQEHDGPRRRIGRARIALAQGDLDRARQLLAGAEGEASSTSRLRVEHLALTAGVLALADEADARPGGSDAVDAALQRLAALVADRGQSLAVVFTPVAAVEAMLRATERRPHDPGLIALLMRAQGAAVIGSKRVRLRLTERELAVARELPHHTSVDALAAAMSVSRNTVKSQLRTLYRKLEVGSRDEALQVMAAWEISARV